MALSIFLTPHDVEVYRTSPGSDRAAGVEWGFFQTLADCYRECDDTGQWWFVVTCAEGGVIRAPLPGPSLLFSEPERH